MEILILGSNDLTDDEKEITKQHAHLFAAVDTMTALAKEIIQCLMMHKDFALWLNHAQGNAYVAKTLALARDQGADPVIIYSFLESPAEKEMLRICTEEGWEFLTFENFCKKYLTEDA